jgi:hypothetical protein
VGPALESLAKVNEAGCSTNVEASLLCKVDLDLRPADRNQRHQPSPTKTVESDISICANGDFSIWRLQRVFA